jgi:hypothetical protein
LTGGHVKLDAVSVVDGAAATNGASAHTANGTDEMTKTTQI